jgi:hypothetical protein
MSKSVDKRLEAQLGNQPVWVCSDCGDLYGRRPMGTATFHEGTCEVCGEIKSVTEPRDFGYLKPEWIMHRRYKLNEKEQKNRKRDYVNNN